MKKVLATTLLALSMLTGVAYAGALEDVKALNPKIETKVSTYQNTVGKQCQKLTTTIFEAESNGDTIYVRLLDLDGEKSAFIDVMYYGSNWRFYDFAYTADGNNKRIFDPKNQYRNARQVGRGYVSEYLMFEPTADDWQFMTKAVLFRAVSNSKGYVDINITKPKKKSLTFQKACEIAQKYITE